MNTVHNECQSPRTHYSLSHSAGSRTHNYTRRCVAGANTPVGRSLCQKEDTREDNLEDTLEDALQDNLGDVLQHTLKDAVEMFNLEVKKACWQRNMLGLVRIHSLYLKTNKKFNYLSA